MPLREKYPITDRVLSRDCIKIGDIIAFYDDELETEIKAEVVQFSDSFKHFIIVKHLNKDITETLNIYSNIVYKVADKLVTLNKCTCGAKYTSNSKFHLSYCDIKD